MRYWDGRSNSGNDKRVEASATIVSMSGDWERAASGSSDITLGGGGAETKGQIREAMTGHDDVISGLTMSDDSKGV